MKKRSSKYITVFDRPTSEIGSWNRYQIWH